jgi:hypothetical protein
MELIHFLWRRSAKKRIDFYRRQKNLPYSPGTVLCSTGVTACKESGLKLLCVDFSGDVVNF